MFLPAPFQMMPESCHWEMVSDQQLILALSPGSINAIQHQPQPLALCWLPLHLQGMDPGLPWQAIPCLHDGIQGSAFTRYGPRAALARNPLPPRWHPGLCLCKVWNQGCLGTQSPASTMASRALPLQGMDPGLPWHAIPCLQDGTQGSAFARYGTKAALARDPLPPRWHLGLCLGT